MATFRLSILMAVLILGGCQAPSTPARFITDTSVDSSLSLVSFSDPRDYLVEVIRVDTQGKQTTVSSHELIAHREGLAGVLYVQTKPRLRIVGRGANVFEQFVAAETEVIGIHTIGRSASLDPSSIVWCAFLQTNGRELSTTEFPVLPHDIIEIQEVAKKSGIAAIAIRVSVNKRS
jgi:hypothetical protein